jgi:hypothetical protein
MTTPFRALAMAGAPLRSSSSTLRSWGAFMRCGKIRRFRGCWIVVRWFPPIERMYCYSECCRTPDRNRGLIKVGTQLVPIIVCCSELDSSSACARVGCHGRQDVGSTKKTSRGMF